VVADAHAARGLAKNRHALGISAKGLDVALHPAQRLRLIEQPVVAVRGVRRGTVALQLGLLLAISAYVRRVLIARHAARVRSGHVFLPDDVQWDESTSVLYPLACMVAGLCAGLFGIGGGIIKGPLMLEMGMLPQVASATSAFMILFTSASAALQYATLGDLRPVYGLVLFVAGTLGTALGQLIVGAMLKRWGRQSLIVLIIAAIIGGSTLVMTVTGVLDFHSELVEGKSQGFRPLCASALVDE